jgi:anti-sigma B factor antagonist
VEGEGLGSFSVETSVVSHGATIAVHGELDLYTAPRLEEALMDALLADGVDHVCIDLADVALLDSTALGVLVRAYRRLGANGLVIVPPTGPAWRTFATTGLDRWLRLQD